MTGAVDWSWAGETPTLGWSGATRRSSAPVYYAETGRWGISGVISVSSAAQFGDAISSVVRPPEHTSGTSNANLTHSPSRRRPSLALWGAVRVARGQAISIPTYSPLDEYGLRMEMLA